MTKGLLLLLLLHSTFAASSGGLGGAPFRSTRQQRATRSETSSQRQRTIDNGNSSWKSQHSRERKEGSAQREARSEEFSLFSHSSALSLAEHVQPSFSAMPQPPSSSLATPRSGWLDLPNTFQTHLPGFCCVGCASDNPIGMRLRMQVHETLPLFRAPFIPTHTFSGFPRLCQGGVQAVAIDCLAEWAWSAQQTQREKHREQDRRILISCLSSCFSVCRLSCSIYLTHNIGVTTRLELSFLKGVPAAPAASDAAGEVSHLRSCVAPPPQMLPLAVQFICSARPPSHPSRLVLDIRLEDASSTCVYARGVVHMMLPSVAQMTKMFRGASTIAQIQTSVAALPRPNAIVLRAASPPPRLPPSSSSSAASSAAAAASSSAVAVPAAPSSQPVAPTAAAASFSTSRSFAHLIEAPSLRSDLGNESEEWVCVPDALGSHIAGYSCFGCGADSPLGLRCEFELNVRSGALRCWLRPSSAMAGFPATLHGGLAIVAIDCLAAWCAMTHTAKLALTTHVETICMQAAPVPRIDEEARATSTAAAAASTHLHAHGESCASPHHSTTSLAQLPASSAPYRLLLQGELVSLMSGGRQGDVVVNLYDASSSSCSSSAQHAPPRLCMSARLRFTFATHDMASRLMGDEYAPGIKQAMRQLAEFKREVEERNAAKGVTAPPTNQSSTKAKL